MVPFLFHFEMHFLARVYDLLAVRRSPDSMSPLSGQAQCISGGEVETVKPQKGTDASI